MSLDYMNGLRLLMAAGALVSSSWVDMNDAHAGSCCGGGKTTQVGALSARTVPERKQVTERPFQGMHGGQLTKTIWNYFEVVYGPTETRLYVFDVFRSPVRIPQAQGQVTMHVYSSGEEYTYPLRYERSATGHDYLAAIINLTQVQQKDMEVKFNLRGLPGTAEPYTEFTQIFGAPATEPIAIAYSPENQKSASVAEKRGPENCCDGGSTCCGASAKRVAPDCCQHGNAARTPAFARGSSRVESSLRRLPPIEGI